MTNATNNPNAPVAELRDGRMKIAIFRHEPSGDVKYARFSGKLTRSFQDANGDWHDSEYLSSTEYLKAANLLIEAYNTERELRQAERSPVPES